MTTISRTGSSTAATAPIRITRHPMDVALDEYTTRALASGDPERIRDAERAQLIRAHALFDDLITYLRANRIPVRPRRAAARTEKGALTGSLPRASADDSYERASVLAKTIVDTLGLSRGVWVERVLVLANEYAHDGRASSARRRRA